VKSKSKILMSTKVSPMEERKNEVKSPEFDGSRIYSHRNPKSAKTE